MGGTRSTTIEIACFLCFYKELHCVAFFVGILADAEEGFS
jgi:hypothetical protein